MDSKVKNFLVRQKCKEFLAFSSPEMGFLVDSSSCSNKKSYKCQRNSYRIALFLEIVLDCPLLSQNKWVFVKAGLWTLDWTHGLDYGPIFGPSSGQSFEPSFGLMQNFTATITAPNRLTRGYVALCEYWHDVNNNWQQVTSHANIRLFFTTLPGWQCPWSIGSPFSSCLACGDGGSEQKSEQKSEQGRSTNRALSGVQAPTKFVLCRCGSLPR